MTEVMDLSPAERQLRLITPELVSGLSAGWIEQVGLAETDLGTVMPVGFEIPDKGEPVLEVADWSGLTSRLPAEGIIPNMRFLSSDNLAAHGDRLAAFWHRKGGQPRREDALRLLRITGADDPNGFLPTTFWLGEHQDHLGQWGVNIRAQHVGSIGTAFLTSGRLEEVHLLDPHEVKQKYFPIGPAAEIGLE